MKNKSSILMTVLFFGAMWGLLEASLGYVLHFLPPLIAGGVMFPIGTILMYWAYKNTNSKSTIIYVGLIAAGIKSINFMMPGLAFIRTYHPMMSIVLQSLSILMVVSLFEKKSIGSKIGAVVLSSITWRTLFVGLITTTFLISGIFSTQLTNVSTLFSFIITNGVMEITILLVATLVYQLFGKKLNLTFVPKWPLSIATLALAVAIRLIPFF